MSHTKKSDKGDWCMIAAVVLLTTAFAANATGPIYESRDRQGRRTYSDQPTANAVRRSDIERQQPPSASAAEQATQSLEALRRTEEARQASEQERQQAEAVARDVESERKKQCQKARNRLLDVTQVRRPYRRRDDGEREYLTASQIDAERLAAQKAVDSVCGTGKTR